MIDGLNKITVPAELAPFIGDYYKALVERDRLGLLGQSEYRCFRRWLSLYDCGKYRFAAKAIKRMFGFLGMLHVMGQAGKLEPFKLYPVQKFILCGIFGLRYPDGRYLVNTANLYMARRNGKSFLLAAILHYLLTMSNFRQELIILASCKGENADICFKEFCRFIDNDPDLAETFANINRSAKWAKSAITGNELDLFRTGGSGKKTLDGFTNKVAVIDEEMLCDPIIPKTLQDGQAHYVDSLLVTMSTAQFDIGGTNHKRWIATRRGLYDGTLPDNQFVYLADPDTVPGKQIDYADIHTWGKANPVLIYEPDGYTLKDFMVKRYTDKARRAVAVKGFDLQSFATKQCNLWYSAEDRGLCTYDEMINCGVDFSFKDCIDAGYKDWYIGVDLSHTLDLSSVTFLGFVKTKDGKLVPAGTDADRTRLFVHTISFLPAGKLQEHIESDKFTYSQYVGSELFLCNGGGGESIDTQQILQYIKKIQFDNDLHYITIAADPYNIAGIQGGLQDICDCFILQNQSPKSLSQYIEALSTALKGGDVAYSRGGEDIWERGMTNGVLIKNPSGFISFEKLTLRADSNVRIDPVDAMITGFIAPYIDYSNRGPSADESVDEWEQMMGVKSSD
nr:MAG TPA: Large Terminase [Bacteriophage sp.]